MEGLLILIAFVAIVVSLFLLFREIVLWYWKINEMVGTLKLILAELKRINIVIEEDSKSAA
jgi:hypothetical protein